MKVNSNQQGMKNSTFIPDFALANIKIGCCYLPRVQLDEFNLLFNTMGASFSLVTEEALEIIKQWTGVQQIWKHQAKTQRSKKKPTQEEVLYLLCSKIVSQYRQQAAITDAKANAICFQNLWGN